MKHSAHLTLSLFLLTFVTAHAPAQSATSPVNTAIQGGITWRDAQQIGSSQRRLLIVTLDEPRHRHSCRVVSFTQDKLACSRAFGGPRIYYPQQILALWIPGDDATRIKLLLGLNAAMGAAIWGTVVLAATCPACAAATATAALLLFCAAGAISYGDGQSERLIYRAPGQELSHH